MSQKDLIQLVLESRELRRSKDLATAESMLYEAIPVMARNPKGIGATLKDLTHDSIYSIRSRNILLLADPASDPLWERVDSDLSLNAAVKILQRARARVGDLAENVKSLLEEHGDLPKVVKLADGKVVRKHTQSGRGFSEPLKGLASKVRREVFSYVRKQHPNLPEKEADRIAFEAWTDFRVILVTAKAVAKRLDQIGFGNVDLDSRTHKNAVRSCEILGMEPPGHGQPVDLKLARKNMRKRAFSLHPDKHGGSEALRPEYQAVVSAYASLAEYNKLVSGECTNP